jgi:type IV secretion system protein VirD4
VGRAGDFLRHFLFGLVVLVNRIRSFFQHSQTLHNARFANLHELTGLLTERFDDPPAGGLLLGISRFNNALRVQPTQIRRELGNVLVVAPTRGGKGLLATSQLHTWPHSVIVNDIKGELFTQTAGYRSTLGKVYVIDPTGIGNRFDPLRGKHTDLELKSIAKSLLYKPDEGDGEVFTQRATRMLTQLLHAARIEQVSPLRYVAAMINEPIKMVAGRIGRISPQLAIRFLDDSIEDADFQNKFLLSGWSTITSRLDSLLAESIVECFAGNDFTPHELLCAGKPITVYLRWPEKDLLVLAPLVRLMWGTLIDELITAYDVTQGNDCNPVLLLIDEAGRTAIPSLADHATTVVGRGISLWVAIQDLNQLDAVYGRRRAHVLRNNMESQIYYRPNDQETAEYLERCLGRKSDFAHSQTLREGEQTSEGRMEQGISLMTAQEIKQMPDDRIIGFHRQLPPFLATRMDWRRFPVLTERQAIPPPALSPLPELTETLPTLTPHSNGQLTGFINPDMTG